MNQNTVHGRAWSLAIVTGAAAILAAGLMVAPARAEGDLQPRSERVSYADLDLSREAGRLSFERRLRGAVRRVCRAHWDVSIAAQFRERDCRRRTMSAAYAQMQRAVLLASAR